MNRYLPMYFRLPHLVRRLSTFLDNSNSWLEDFREIYRFSIIWRLVKDIFGPMGVQSTENWKWMRDIHRSNSISIEYWRKSLDEMRKSKIMKNITSVFWFARLRWFRDIDDDNEHSLFLSGIDKQILFDKVSWPRL